MPDQLFTYHIENPLVMISLNSGSLGWVMVIRLEIETWVIGKGGTKKRKQKRGGWLGEEMWGLLDLVAFMCVRV
jgi:hypothetical protein